MLYLRGGIGKSYSTAYSTAPPVPIPRHGWEGRGRTFIRGFKGPGPAVRRPPSAPAILTGGRDIVKAGAGSPLVRPDHGVLDHLPGLVVQWVSGVPIRAVLRLLARHGDEQAGAPLDDLEVADDETVVEDDRGVPFQLLVVRHRKDLHLGDPHPGLLPFLRKLDASPDEDPSPCSPVVASRQFFPRLPRLSFR